MNPERRTGDDRGDTGDTTGTITLRRTYSVSLEVLWELWTTPAGIGEWWAPDGFVTEVQTLELRPGGALLYSMTATAPAQVEFMKSAGLPLFTRSRKTFTTVDRPHRLAYRSLIDFVPDHEPYEHLTTVQMVATDHGTELTMIMESLHDVEWTQRLVAGRSNELDNLTRLIQARS